MRYSTIVGACAFLGRDSTTGELGLVHGGESILHFGIPDPLHLSWKIPVDIYVVTPETWGTLVLIRTGSKENNQRLCQRAIDLGYKLHADGGGLTDGEGVKIAGDELSIYEKLGLPYQAPEYRG